MSTYTLENFKADIRTNREFEFTFHNKSYSLTFSKVGYIFTDIYANKDVVFKTYDDLLKDIKIEGKQIEEIISQELYDDLSIY